MTTRLYHHKTDGGAEYLCLRPVEGTDEGNLWTTVVRLDGEPELMGVFDGELLEALKALLIVADKTVSHEDHDRYCEVFSDAAPLSRKQKGSRP